MKICKNEFNSKLFTIVLVIVFTIMLCLIPFVSTGCSENKESGEDSKTDNTAEKTSVKDKAEETSVKDKLADKMIDVSDYFTLDFPDEYDSQTEGYIMAEVTYDSKKMNEDIKQAGGYPISPFYITSYLSYTKESNNGELVDGKKFSKLHSDDTIHINIDWDGASMGEYERHNFEMTGFKFDTTITDFDIKVKDVLEEKKVELKQPVKLNFFEKLDEMGDFLSAKMDGGKLKFGLNTKKLKSFSFNEYIFQSKDSKYYLTNSDGSDIDIPFNTYIYSKGLYFSCAKGKVDKKSANSVKSYGLNDINDICYIHDLKPGDIVTVMLCPPSSDIKEDEYWIEGTDIVLTPTKKQYKVKLSK